MAIPDYESLMLPVLETISDGRVYKKQEIVQTLADRYKLTTEEREQTVESGTNMFSGRVHWAVQYMLNAGLVIRPQRAHVQITERGKGVLKNGKKDIDVEFLSQYPEFQQWRFKPRSENKEKKGVEKTPINSSQTPEELLRNSYDEIRGALVSDILDRTKLCSPAFFERLVVRLLVKMGYGGSESEAIARVTGKSGDGGIDGIIQEDKLGLDSIYVQAKRWKGTVGPGDVRDFSGSLDQHGAKKGVMITTSRFTDDAQKFVSTARSDKKIVLIDGFRLAELMIDYNVGVSTDRTYEIKKIDSDYFEED